MADDNQNLSDPSRLYGNSLFGQPESDITKVDRDFLEQKRLADSLRDAKPNWQTDGKGVRGDTAAKTVQTPNDKLRTDFPPGSVRREPRQPAFPEVPDSETGNINGTPVDIYGSVNGQPAIFHLLQTSPPTPLLP